MNKQGIYITMINSFIGIVASLLLKDNAVVALVIGALVISTIVFIERAWLHENLFRNRKSYARTTYSVLVMLFLVGLFLVTEPARKTSAIIASTTAFINGVKTGNFETAYAQLSQVSRQEYPLAEFTEDHSKNHIKIQDFTIDQVVLNKYDNKKASAQISSPFMLYGHETLNLELLNEDNGWRVVFSKKILATVKPPPLRTKKSGGVITSFFNALF